MVTGRGPGRRHPLGDGIMRVADVCDWRGVEHVPMCGYGDVGVSCSINNLVISPHDDQTLPPESVGAMVSPGHAVESPVFFQLSREQ